MPLAAVRCRLPPPTRRPVLWAELLRHFRGHGGHLTLLDPPRPSFATVPPLAGGNAAAVKPRRAAFAPFGGHRPGKWLDRCERLVQPVFTGQTSVVNRLIQSTNPFYVLISQNS